MKIKAFLKDKLYLIIVYVFVSVMLFLMLDTISVQIEVIIISLFALFMVFFSVMIVEFKRRYFYYKDIIKTINSLEDPYLIYEMYPDKNNFIDAHIFEDIVRKSNVSMTEKVSLYRSLQEDYKNYIELWVHEIKTPLAAASLIVENSEDKLVGLSKELEDVTNYVQQALFYARSNAVSKDYIIQPIVLRDSIRKVIKSLSLDFIRKDISVDLQLLDSVVYTDSKWFEFMLKQILSNSLQYTHHSGSVKIVMSKQNQNIKLEIIDNGIGITSQDLGRIFEQGFTGASGRSYTQATGIGLFLVKQLADALSMKVYAESDKGTTITLLFPQTDMHFKV